MPPFCRGLYPIEPVSAAPDRWLRLSDSRGERHDMAFEYDIFLSYARVDDAPSVPNDPATRWVSIFRETLETHLKRRLGRANQIRTFFDNQTIQGNSPLTPTIEAALKSAAVFVAIGSRGYYHPEATWCRQEREHFVRRLGADPAGQRRVFIVHRDPLPQLTWQAAFFPDVIGYPFYQADADTHVSSVLGEPKLIDNAPEYLIYFKRLYGLCEDIATTIERVRSAPASLAPEPIPGRGVIFLAEAALDLYDAREELKSYLEQQGFRVVPGTLYDRAPEQFERAARADLASALLFIQLLGRYGSPPAPGLPDGYEGLQLRCAREAGKPLLRWRPPELRLDEIKEPHRSRLAAPDVHPFDFEEFKRSIDGELRRLLAAPAPPPPGEGERATVCIAAADADRDSYGVQVGQQLGERSCYVDLVPDTHSLVDVAESDEFSAYVILYGQSDPEWVRKRVRECRNIVMKKRDAAPAIALYFCQPPPDAAKKPLYTNFPKLRQIRWDDPQGLDAFLREIPEKGAAP